MGKLSGIQPFKPTNLKYISIKLARILVLSLLILATILALGFHSILWNWGYGIVIGPSIPNSIFGTMKYLNLELNYNTPSVQL